MKIKTLLLGSSAVLGVVGAAQAADTVKPAAVTKPAPVVQYVQVCDLYGLGYFIIPGQKDTCLRVQGQVQFQLNFHTVSLDFRPSGSSSPHSSAWDTNLQGQLTFTAKRQTDHGDLIGVVRLTSTSNNTGTFAVGQTATANTPAQTIVEPAQTIVTTDSAMNTVTVVVPARTITVASQGAASCAKTACSVPNDRYVQLDRGYIQLGSKFSVLLGYNSSIFGAGTTKQVSFAFDLGGGTQLQLGLDDPRDRWGSRLPRVVRLPDFVGNLTGNYALGTFGLSAGAAEVAYPEKASPVTPLNGGYGPPGWVYAVSAKTTIKADSISKGDQLTLQFVYGTGCQFITCTGSVDDPALGALWQGIVGFKHVFSSTVNTTAQFQYTNGNNAASTSASTFGQTGKQWVGSLTTQWTPTNDRNFQIQSQVRAQQTLGTSSSTNSDVIWQGQEQFVWSF